MLKRLVGGGVGSLGGWGAGVWESGGLRGLGGWGTGRLGSWEARRLGGWKLGGWRARRPGGWEAGGWGAGGLRSRGMGAQELRGGQGVCGVVTGFPADSVKPVPSVL